MVVYAGVVIVFIIPLPFLPRHPLATQAMSYPFTYHFQDKKKRRQEEEEELKKHYLEIGEQR